MLEEHLPSWFGASLKRLSGVCVSEVVLHRLQEVLRVLKRLQVFWRPVGSGCLI